MKNSIIEGSKRNVKKDSTKIMTTDCRYRLRTINRKMDAKNLIDLSKKIREEADR